MPDSSVPAYQAAGTLSAAMRAVRRFRGLRVGDLAQRMGMARRSYEYFEANGALDLARVRRFAESTATDPYALLLSAPLGRPDLAVRCAANRMLTIIMGEVQDLDTRLGDDLRLVAEEDCRQVFSAAFRELARRVREADGGA